MPRPKLRAERHRILRNYFQDLAEVMAEEGLGEAYAPLLADLGLGPEAFGDVEGSLTFDTYLAALEALDRDGRIAGLGLKLGARKRHRTFGFVAMGAIAQGSMLASHHFAAASFELYWGSFLRLEGRVDQAWIVGRYLASPPELAFHATIIEQAAMTAVCLFNEAMTGLDWSQAQARFMFPPPKHVALYARMLPMACSFDQPYNELWFPASWAEVPSTLGDATIKEFCEAGFQAMMDEERATRTYAQRIHDLLVVAEPGHWPGLPALAQRLGLPERKVRAGLVAEGTTLRTLLNGVIIEQAQQLLANPRLSIKEIAFRLGFAQPPSFYRAFTRATGLTPEQFRTRAQQDR